jgi:RimJ/RimL family protein N-acetyltransferase
MQNLNSQLKRLRIEGAFAQARELIRSQPDFGKSRPLQQLLHEHEDFWWAPIIGRRVTLRRRGPEDLDFVRACWADADFMRKFNRVARALPADDEALHGILARERAGTFGEAKALHWTIHTASGPIGFVSATDYAPGHRRCEFLVGALQQRPSPAPIEACHVAVAFLRDKAGIERLTAYFYAENAYAARVAAKFGFEPEGVLKGYIRASDGTRSDLAVAGLLLTSGSSFSVKKTHRRLTALR